MQNREVTVALCGAIVGVIVGAGTFVTARDSALGASAFVAYRNIMNTQVMPRSDALRRQDNTTELSTSSSSSSSVAPVVEPETDAVPVECAVKKELEAAFLNAIDSFLPLNPRNMEAREKLRAAAKSIGASYCVVVPTAHGAAPAAPAAKIDNDCEQYGVKTARYWACMASESGGRVYP